MVSEDVIAVDGVAADSLGYSIFRNGLNRFRLLLRSLEAGREVYVFLQFTRGQLHRE
jgi:hypothetical protein